MKELIVWFDGKFVPLRKARVPLLSHALHYGTGAFEGIRAYETPRGPAVFRLKEHVDRFYASAQSLGMHIPFSRATLAKAIRETVARNKFSECYIRPLVFYGEGQMALAPHGAKLHVAVAAWPWGAYLGEHRALSIGVSPFLRFHPQSVVPGAKISGYYATSVLATLEARARHFDEAVLLDHDGFVAEGPGENIFMVKKGKLFTPRSPSILPGITRASVMRIARGLRIPVAEKKIALTELLSADEVFLTGTAAEVAPVGKVNGRKIGKGRPGAPGPITLRLRDAYLAATHGLDGRYREWLTRI